MKKLFALCALAAALAPALSQAAETSLAFNVGAVSDYRYRGISQTRVDPALQGGVDLGLPNGAYVGAWASSIKWIKDGGGGANAEIDVYAGLKFQPVADLSMDIGWLTYQYPGHDFAISPNTHELYAALSNEWLSFKLSYSLTNLFGFEDSKGSIYYDLSSNIDLGDGFMLTPHVGHQSVKNLGAASYSDYSVTLAKDFGNGVTVTGALLKANTDVYVGKDGTSLTKTGLVVGVKYSF